MTVTHEPDSDRQDRARAYLGTMIAATRAVTGAKDRQLLLDRACAAIAGHGAFVMAWIGADLDEDGWIERLAVAGDLTGYTDAARIAVTDVPEGRGPTGTAARTGQPVVVTDIASDERMVPWRPMLLGRGFHSCAAFPLRSRALPCGVLSVYAVEPGALGVDEASVVDDLAAAIGYAADALAEREALAASEEQRRVVLEHTTDIISIVDNDGVFTWMSPSVQRVLGMPPEAYIGHRLIDYLHPDDQAAVITAQQVILGGDTTRATFRVTTASGDWRWLEVDAHPVRDADGTITGRIATSRDVTERREAEQAVRRLVTAIEQSGDSIVVTDVDANIVYANPAFEAVTGYPRDEVLGKNPRILQSGLQDRAFYTAMWASLTAGETWRGVLHNKRRDGTLYTESATISPVRGADGEIANYAAVKRDVTAALEAEGRLRRLAAAVDQAGEAVIVTDPTGAIVYVNPQFERNTGYPRDEVLGKNPRILKSGHHNAAFYEEMWATLLAGKAWRGELHNRRKDGGIVIEETVIAPVFGADGQLESYVGLKHDITLRRQLEDTVSRAERLDSMARVTAAAAHDFGNVLQGILFYQSILADQVPDGAYASDVAAIGEAAQRGVALTRQMLAVGRDAPRGEAAPLDPAELVRAMEPMLVAVASPCRLRVDAPSTGLALATRSSVEQAVLNLVINARDAMAGHAGSISVSVRPVQVTTGSRLGLPPGAYHATCVADDGPGMPPDVRDHAFEPFFTTKPEGTGIGLASVFSSAREFGGTATIESAPGEGASVTFYLPVWEG